MPCFALLLPQGCVFWHRLVAVEPPSPSQGVQVHRESILTHTAHPISQTCDPPPPTMPSGSSAPHGSSGTKQAHLIPLKDAQERSCSDLKELYTVDLSGAGVFGFEFTSPRTSPALSLPPAGETESVSLPLPLRSDLPLVFEEALQHVDLEEGHHHQHPQVNS